MQGARLRPAVFAARVLAMLALASVSVGGCGSSTEGPGSTGTDAGTESSAAGAYGDLKGTFIAPGVSATITGAVVGTFQCGMTQWNGEGSPDLGASNGTPTPMTVKGTFPAAGDTGYLVVNLANITTMPASGTFDCSGSSAGYMLNVEFQVFPGGSTTAKEEWGGLVTGATCSMTLDTPVKVSESSIEGSVDVYLAHGSLTATLVDVGIDGAMSNGTTGHLSLTW
jgi:hypothetical protein